MSTNMPSEEALRQLEEDMNNAEKNHELGQNIGSYGSYGGIVNKKFIYETTMGKATSDTISDLISGGCKNHCW